MRHCFLHKGSQIHRADQLLGRAKQLAEQSILREKLAEAEAKDDPASQARAALLREMLAEAGADDDSDDDIPDSV